MEQPYAIEMLNITKRFPGIVANDNITLQLKRGEIHALLGENGAGKSTLLKIITGLYTKDSGTIYMDGKEIDISNVETAKKHGIHVVPQEMQMLRELSVAENIFLGNPPRTRLGTVDWKTMYRRANEVKGLLGKHGERIDVRAKAGDLGMGAWQLIEIMRAFTSDHLRVIAFDEPTSSLSDSEVEALFSLIRDLRDRGIAIVYVSHRMKEIYELCDEVSIFRDGQYIKSCKKEEIDRGGLISLMVGRKIEFDSLANPVQKSEVVLEVSHLSKKGNFKDISFTLHKGEILGITGLVGAGRSEMVQALFGLNRPDSGTVKIDGRETHIDNTWGAVDAGIGYIPESRQTPGVGCLINRWRKTLHCHSLKSIQEKFGFDKTRKKQKETVVNG